VSVPALVTMRPSRVQAARTDIFALFGNDLDAELSDSLAYLASFADQPDLLRGLPLWRALQHWGALFGSAQGTQATYDLSKVVTGIEAFVSHNWSVGRTSESGT